MDSGVDGLGYESAFVVSVNWNSNDSKWNVNTWNRDNNDWNSDNRVFSPETIEFLPRPILRKFSFEVLYASLRLVCPLPQGLGIELRISYCRIGGAPRLFEEGI